jgi:hypothetical protein
MPRGKILKCSHIPIKKTVVYGAARFLYCPWILLRFGNTPLGRSHALRWFYLRRIHSVQEPEPMSTPGSSTTTMISSMTKYCSYQIFGFGLLQIL